MTVLTVWRDARRVGVLDTTPTGDVRFTYDTGDDVVQLVRFSLPASCRIFHVQEVRPRCWTS